jgi:hypothetical protein
VSERRYTEDEVARILERAAEAPLPDVRDPSISGASRGLTLADLQAIGGDVGIPAAAIARAAEALGVAESTSSVRTVFGLPLRVTHTVELGRRLSDDEWERLVVDLRETFDARGRVTSHGSLREWTNGNLQALLEPTDGGGHRLRLRTFKGNALGRIVGGVMMMGASATMLLVAAQASAFGDTGMVAALATLGLAGAGMFGAGALRLPAWARTRRQQMDALAARAAARGPEPLR